MAAVKKGGLGRGLDALFADGVLSQEVKAVEKAEKSLPIPEATDSAEQVRYLDIHRILPNANQPRKIFDEAKIEELSNSIMENGIIQPILVRRKGENFEIVAGERRWRAAMKAELSKVPCLIRELDDEQNMLVAIIENMQREDLNPLEEAEGLNQMLINFGMTQEQISKSLGKSRPYITNALRLLKLPEYIKEALASGQITAGHGRTLLSLENEELRKQLLHKIIKEGLSVRETEKQVDSLGKSKKRPAKRSKNPDLARVEGDLKDALGTRVNIVQTGKKGKIEIEFFSRDELERLVEILKSL